MITVVVEARRSTATAEYCSITEQAVETHNLCCSMHKKKRQLSTSYFKYGFSLLRTAQYDFLVDVFHIISTVQISKNTC